jgi:linoleoyl-CoA desaturase
MGIPKFSNSTSPILTVLKKRISEYFQKENISPTGNYKLFIKAGILSLVFILVYSSLLVFSSPYWLVTIECILLGVLTASIGFNVMHDGAHGSFSKYKWLNKIAATSFDFLGASSFMWKVKHNVIHHAYTNIDGVDDDINAQPFLRLCATQKRYKIYRYQYIYFWFLYSLLYLFWVFFTDYKKYFTHKIGSVSLPKFTLKNHITFWSFKMLHIFLFVALPVYLYGVIPWLFGFLICTMVAGLLLSIVFQLAHTVEETSFPVLTESSDKLEDEWALHQLKSTANFATKNKFITWWLGGLNFQIEHHLFPKISHIHYPAICKIVRQTCAESKLPYIEHRKIHLAVRSHIFYLKKLGR